MKIFSFVLAAIILTGCATVPLTGRKQLDMIPDSELIPMSFASYEEVIAGSTLSSDKEQTEMVKRVGDRIKTAVETFLSEQPILMS